MGTGFSVQPRCCCGRCGGQVCEALPGAALGWSCGSWNGQRQGSLARLGLRPLQPPLMNCPCASWRLFMKQELENKSARNNIFAKCLLSRLCGCINLLVGLWEHHGTH